MIRGIDHVAINVRNLDQALKFYTETLGLRISPRENQKPGVEYFLDAGPSLIGLIQADLKGSEHPFSHDGVGANHFSFRIHTQDFDQAAAKLQTSGVEISFIRKREKSWSIYFKDMDGNKLEMTAWPREDKT